MADIETKMMLVGAVKAAGAGFEGWASTASLDRQGDVVEPSAFARSLPEFLANGLIFWQHAHAFDPLAKPIGKATSARIADSGLYIEARWADTPEAQEVRSLVVDGIVNSLSIGFTPRQMHRDSALGHNVITDLDLLEVSVVAIPANSEARIVAAKSYLAHTTARRRRVISGLA
jgi:HK97 family phage prohead protease